MTKLLRSSFLFLALFASLSLAAHPCEHGHNGGSLTECHLCQTATISADISASNKITHVFVEEAVTAAETAGYQTVAFSVRLTRGPPAA